MPTDDKELAFRSCLWRLFRAQLINQYSHFISEQVDKTIDEAHENGITDYNEWMKWMIAGKKKGAGKNAKPKRTRSGVDMAQK